MRNLISNKLDLLVILFLATHSVFGQGIGAGSLFAKVGDEAEKATEAYAAVYESFYGVGHARTLLKATLDTRADGTPNITLDRAAGKALFTIRLSTDEAAYEKWRKAAHKRIESVGSSVAVSNFKDTSALPIGGTFYRFSDNQMSALERWEKSDKKPKPAELVVRVALVDAEGKTVRGIDLPISSFRRSENTDYPIPLNHLNRLRDLPNARYRWGTVEDSFAGFTISDLTDSVMNSIVDVKCSVVDDETLVPEREEAVVKSILDNMVPIPGKDYLMGRTEVTQEQYECINKRQEANLNKWGKSINPSFFKNPAGPVENVDWMDCSITCALLNELPLVKQAGLVFRLPTSEEWEFACKAGATPRCLYCKAEDGSEISEDTLNKVAWFHFYTTNKQTHPVGKKMPNAFGLYDTFGNVSEWSNPPSADGDNDYLRVCGGSWKSEPDECWLGSIARKDNRNNTIGFRFCADRKRDIKEGDRSK